MIKMMILASRRDGLTHDEFRRYVTEIHGPLVKSVRAVAQDIRHYHYNFPIAGAVDAAFGHPLADDLDILTEAWFDSVQAHRDNQRRPGYMEILRPDEHRFADGERATMHYTQESPVLSGEATLNRVFYLRHRRPGLSRCEFQERWLAGMRTIFNEAIRPAGVAGYVQNLTIAEAEHPDGGEARRYDVVDELFLEQPGALALLEGNAGLREEVRRLGEMLVDTTRTRAFVGETVLNIP